MNDKTMPFFSVIITVYNKEPYINETIKSVCSQDFSDIEIILVNDGSTDHSLKEISKIIDPRIKIFSIPNSGVSFARNFGVQNSKGKYCAFLDGDDLWEDFHLSEVSKSIQKFPDHLIFSCASKILKKNSYKDLTYTIENKPIQTLNYFKSSLKDSIINSSSIVIEKQTFLKSKGFDTKLSNGQDTEYWFRLGLQFPIVFSKKTTVIIRDVELSFSKQKFDSENRCFFEAFETIETDNESFYKVLDNNLFSSALLCKQNNFMSGYHRLKSRIHKRNNLSTIQLILLNSPSFLIKPLRKLKVFFENIGVSITVIK